MHKIIILCLLFIIPTTVSGKELIRGNPMYSGGFMTGNEYRNISENEKLFYAMGFCNAIKVATGFIIINEECIHAEWVTDNMFGKKISGDQIKEIISKYIDKHPEKWHESLCILSWEAIYNAFHK